MEGGGDVAEEICYTPDWEEGSSPGSHSSSSSVSDESSTSGEYVYSRVSQSPWLNFSFVVRIRGWSK